MPNKSDLQMELTKVITQYDVNSTAPYVHLQKTWLTIYQDLTCEFLWDLGHYTQNFKTCQNQGKYIFNLILNVLYENACIHIL